MGMNRRDIMRFAGGSAAGLLLSPLPWKLLDDSSIWTQNWSWTPRLPHGEVSTRWSACTLCPEACGVVARSVTDRPYQLAGVSGHPSGGSLCPAGIIGHHVAYHPARVRQVLHRGRPAKLARVIDALAAAKGTLAILDQRPGRAISELHRRSGALYLTPPPREEATLAKLRELVENPPAAFGIDLERTRTVLSFGAPVLDGWAAPARVWAARAQFRLIHADTRHSRTADLADLWLPIRPGTETALALGIANILLHDGLVHADAPDLADYRALVERFTPEVVAGIAGIDREQLRAAAHEFGSGAPAIAIGGGDPAGGPLGEDAELAIAALNLLTGNVGRPGGIVGRRELFDAGGASITSVADHSIRALIIDAAPSSDLVPWDLISRKLAWDAVVIALAAFPEGAAAHADFIVPAPAPFETLQDTGTPFDSPRAMFGLAAPLMPLAAGAIEPEAFLTRLAEARGLPKPGTVESVLKERAAAAYRSGRGIVFNYSTGQSVPVASIESAEKFWTALLEGACWMDDEPAPAAPRSFRLLGRDHDAAARLIAAAEHPPQPAGGFPVALEPHGWRAAIAGAPSPLMTKLYQESGLRPPANEAAVHPETARACGIEDGGGAVVETVRGATNMRVRITGAVRPGVLEAAIAPSCGVLDLCPSEREGWRLPAARIRRAS